MVKKTSSPKLSRRDFTKVVTTFVGSIMGVVIGLPVIGYLIDPAIKRGGRDDWVPMGPLENYPLGEPTLFTFTRSKVNGWEKTTNSYGVFVLRKSEKESDIELLSNVCTHLSCRVNWHDDSHEYICPCHDAHFNIAGEVISGPPPRPLDPYEFKIEDGTLFLHFTEG